MSCREEQDFAEAVIDSLRFAAEGDCISGKLALSQLSRLSDALVSRDGWLDCKVVGFREASEGAEKFGLHLQVAGQLWLRCQRCLAEVRFDCAINSRLLLMPLGVPSDDWPEDELETDEFDAIPASRELSLLSLIEDEVLLALPIVPRHAECKFPASTMETANEESEPSPFAVLAGLKKH